MDFQKIVHRALDLRRQYEIKETDLYGSPYTSLDLAQGFSGDVNNLVKLIRAERGELQILNSRDKLEAQLAHCLWSVVVLAHIHNVNLETAFMEAMDRLETHLLEAE